MQTPARLKNKQNPTQKTRSKPQKHASKNRSIKPRKTKHRHHRDDQRGVVSEQKNRPTLHRGIKKKRSTGNAEEFLRKQSRIWGVGQVDLEAYRVAWLKITSSSSVSSVH